MAKKLKAIVKLQIPAGKANPAPPIGPALAGHGINLMAFCKEYTARTSSRMGEIVPPLWRSRRRMEHLSVRVQNPGFQPFPNQPQKGGVIDPFLKHPHELVMVNMVEVPAYIRLHHVVYRSIVQPSG